MDNITLDKFRHALTKHRDTLLEWISTDSHHKDVHLGGVNSKDVFHVITELKDALERIDDGKFGHCTECNGEIESDRLALDFTTRVCLDHYSEDQIHALENDLELAAKVQHQLLPGYVPSLPGIQIAVRAEPAHIVGGDYYDFFQYNSGSAQGIALADVMGKGFPASILMSNLQASLRILGPEHDELHTLAVRLNELFRYNLTLIRFISIFLAKIDIDSGILHYCNAGHNPPLWWQATSNSIRWLEPTGPAIGLTHDPEYTTKTLRLGSGDLILLYTDGLTEARNPNGEEFGEHRLASYIRNHFNESAEDLLPGLRKAAASFAGGFQDDVTMLVLSVL
jgi:sigma-B regulation protein RsbU (phosphoserine phosphatase)